MTFVTHLLSSYYASWLYRSRASLLLLKQRPFVKIEEEMKHKKHPNLKPWKPGQSGNPAGRRPGSKNVSTIVRELLGQDAKEGVLRVNSISHLTKGKPTSYAQAMVHVMIQKALEGDVRAVRWLADRDDRSYIVDNPESFFNKSEFTIKVIPSDTSTVS